MANDLVVVRQQFGQMFLVAGTRELYVREQNIRKYEPSLIGKLSHGRKGDEWWNRTTLFPEQIGITLERDIVPLRRVLMIHVSANGGAVVESPINKRWARIYLYEAVSRYILRVRLPVLAGLNDVYWSYVPSLDTEELHRQRTMIVNCIIETMGYHTITGGLAEVSEYVHQELR